MLLGKERTNEYEGLNHQDKACALNTGVDKIRSPIEGTSY